MITKKKVRINKNNKITKKNNKKRIITKKNNIIRKNITKKKNRKKKNRKYTKNKRTIRKKTQKGGSHTTLQLSEQAADQKRQKNIRKKA